jgi:hypothetical protein
VTNQLSPRARALILAEEGIDQPYLWPGGDSGISIGPGYDLGYETWGQFQAEWGAYLPKDQLLQLAPAIGKKGVEAQAIAGQFRGITISQAASDAVFDQFVAPRYIAMTRVAFGSGVDLLPPDAQGALVSLVYNRGAGMDGPRRVEMRAIHELLDHLAKREVLLPLTLMRIAAQFRAMRLLWPAGSDLFNRREHEAALLQPPP